MSGCCGASLPAEQVTGRTGPADRGVGPNDCSTGTFTSCVEVPLPPVRNEFQTFNETTSPIFIRIADDFDGEVNADTVRAGILAGPPTQAGPKDTQRFNSGSPADWTALAPPGPPFPFEGPGARLLGGVIGIPVLGSYDFWHSSQDRNALYIAGPYATPALAQANGPGDATRQSQSTGPEVMVTLGLAQGYWWIDQIVWESNAGFSVMTMSWACNGQPGRNNIPVQGSNANCVLSDDHPGFSPGNQTVPVTCTVQQGQSCTEPGTVCRRDDTGEVVPTGSIAPCP